MENYNVLYKIKSLEKNIIRYIMNNKNINIPENMFPSPTQFQIIEYMLNNNKKEINQKELENVLNIRRATISGVLQSMEKNGLIERITNENDTRSKKIKLNEKTIELYEKKKNKMQEIESTIIKNISPKDLDTFMKVLNIMKENIKENINEEGKL